MRSRPAAADSDGFPLSGEIDTGLDALLPKPQECSTISLPDDRVLIQAAGFEDRTLAAAESIRAIAGSAAVVLEYLPFSDRNRLNDVLLALESKGFAQRDLEVITYNRFEPGDFGQRLRASLIAKGARGVLLDISAMSKLAILLALDVCRDLDLDVQVFYAEAADYGPTQAEFELAKAAGTIHRPTLQVFTGVHGVVRAESLASVAMQGQPTAAIVFMSFNDALTQVLLNTVYPGRLFLVNGRPPIHRWREEATAWIHDQVRREWAEDNPLKVSEELGVLLPEQVTSTLDYRETVVLLINLYWKLSAGHRVLLAPSGSKMQAIGCYFAKALHHDIHIEYPSPEGFQQEYSTGIATRWLIPFGRLSELLPAITEVEVWEHLAIAM